jgi:hypothetical protein
MTDTMTSQNIVLSSWDTLYINIKRRRWRIILRWIFRKWEGVVGTGWSGLRIGTVGGHL